MRKKIPVFIVLAVLAVIILTYLYISSPPVPVAQLIIDTGPVEVMHSGSWSPAVTGMELVQGDSVRTLEGAEARIIFFEYSVMRLAPLTEIMIEAFSPDPDDTYIYIRQEAGRTWNKVLSLSGISSYEVETPEAIASVRGTAFSVQVDSHGTDIQLSEGELEANTYEFSEGQKIRLQQLRLTAGRALMVRPGERLVARELVEDEFIRLQRQKDEELAARVKEKLMERFRPYIPVVKERLNLTAEQIERAVTDFIRNEREPPVPLPELLRKMVERPEIRPQSLAEPAPIPLEQVRARDALMVQKAIEPLDTSAEREAQETDAAIRGLTEDVGSIMQAGPVRVPEPDASVEGEANDTDRVMEGLVKDISSIQSAPTDLSLTPQ
jgi:hypothetical protein